MGMVDVYFLDVIIFRRTHGPSVKTWFGVVANWALFCSHHPGGLEVGLHTITPP